MNICLYAPLYIYIILTCVTFHLLISQNRKHFSTSFQPEPFPQHSSEPLPGLCLCCVLWLTGRGAAPWWMLAWLLSLAHRISRGGNCKALNLVSRLTKCFKRAEGIDGYGRVFFIFYLIHSPLRKPKIKKGIKIILPTNGNWCKQKLSKKLSL